MPRVTARTVTVTLAMVAVALSVLSVAGQLLRAVFPSYAADRIALRFYLDAEANVPTWFMSVELLGCAVLLAVIARARRAEGDPHGRAWAVLAGVFVLLSLDETSQLHEMANRPLREALHTRGALSYPWVVLAVPAVAIFALAYRRFLLALPADTRRAFLGAGALYVGGAVGLELVASGYASARGEDVFYATVLVTAEELVEMLALAFFAGRLVSIVTRSGAGARSAPPAETRSPPPRVA